VLSISFALSGAQERGDREERGTDAKRSSMGYRRAKRDFLSVTAMCTPTPKTTEEAAQPDHRSNLFGWSDQMGVGGVEGRRISPEREGASCPARREEPS